MIVLTSIASIAVFMVTLRALGLMRISLGVLKAAEVGVSAMRDAGLDDEERERAVQSASLQLIGAFFSIVIRGALCFGASALTIWLADVAGVSEYNNVVEFLSRWDVMIVAIVAITIGSVVWIRLWPSK